MLYTLLYMAHYAGPMVYNAGSNFELIGITSFGIGCADPRYPGVYAE